MFSHSLFFFTTAHFHLALVAASISHFVIAITKFSCSSNKKLSPLFSLTLDLCRPFLVELQQLFIFVSLALYCKFVEMAINRSFVFIDSFASFLVLAFFKDELDVKESFERFSCQPEL